MRPITSVGNRLATLREFPEEARSEAGFQLRKVQKSNNPVDWKPMTTVRLGVREASGA